MPRRVSWLAPLVLALAGPAAAQGIGPTLEQLAARADLERELGARVRVRWDPATGCPREVELGAPLPLQAEGAEQAARAAIARLAPLYGWRRPPEPVVEEVAPEGPRRAVRVGLRHDGAPLLGARLRLVLARSGRGPALVVVRGQVERDLPAAVDRGEPPAQAKLRIGGLELAPVESPVGLTRQRGRWTRAREVIQLVDGRPARALVDGRGRTLRVEPACAEGGGAVTGRVLLGADGTPAERPLQDLQVHDPRGGATWTTDAAGRHGGELATLPWGLAGPHERVVAHGGRPWPEGPQLRLVFDAADPRAEAVNVFHHLVAARRLFGAIEGVPGLEALAAARTFATTGLTEVNAMCGFYPVLVDGQRYDHPLFFGRVFTATGLDATVVVHERTHAIVRGLGIGGDGDGGALNEGISDYFAVVHAGGSVVGKRALGPCARDLDVVLRDPEDRRGSVHADGVIVGGALLAARREAGAIVDRLALDAVVRAGRGPTMREWAKALLEADQDATGGRTRPVLVRHLLRRNLIDAPAEANQAPRLKLRWRAVEAGKTADQATEMSTDLVPVDLTKLGDGHLEVTAAAEDPEGQPVTIGAAGLEAAGLLERQEGPGRLTLRLRSPIRAGTHVLAVTAQDPAGETAIRTLTLFVIDEGLGQGGSSTARRVRLDAPAGAATRGPLVEALGLDAALVAEVTSRVAAGDGAQLDVVGPRALEAPIADAALVVRPRAGQEGVHLLVVALRARPWQRASLVEVEVHVGAGPRLDVLALGPSLQGKAPQDDAEVSSTWQPVAPGVPVVVEAGGAVELRLELEGTESADALSVEDAPGLEATLVPAAAAARGEGAELLDRDGSNGRLPDGMPALRARAALWLQAPGEAPTRRRVVVTGRVGEATVRRPIDLVVIPTRNRPPRLEVPAQVERLADGSARFEAKAVDPEGLAVTLRLAHPAGTVAGSAVAVTGDGTVALVTATDARGARAVARVRLLAAKPPGPPPQLEPEPPLRGLIDRVDEAR